MLPQIRQWLRRLAEEREQLQKHERRLDQLMNPGRDVGGPVVNGWVRALSCVQSVLMEFYRREIQIKDLERGLLDFPAILDGQEVFLCWEQSEADLGFWHELEAGYAGRQPLEEED